MIITLILSGVLDYKRPLERPPSGRWLDILGSPTTPFRLSPFDEAALEIALRLQSEAPNTRTIRTIVTNGARDLNFVRSIAAYKLDEIECLHTPEQCLANPLAFLTALDSRTSDDVKHAQVIVMGREHGDLDDGTLPALVANAWKVPFVSNAVSLAIDDETIRIERINMNQFETITTTGPVLIAATNHQKNRLRHPLMKNVMLAKKRTFETRELDDSLMVNSTSATFTNMSPMPARNESSQPCLVFQGTDQEKASQLLDWLKERT